MKRWHEETTAMSDTSTDGTERPTCDIHGCINSAWENDYCMACLNDMEHAALDLAGVP